MFGRAVQKIQCLHNIGLRRMWLMRSVPSPYTAHDLYLLAGIYFSTLSLNKINPALSLLLIAENASTAQISVIRSFLVWRKVPNKLLALTSTKGKRSVHVLLQTVCCMCGPFVQKHSTQ